MCALILYLRTNYFPIFVFLTITLVKSYSILLLKFLLFLKLEIAMSCSQCQFSLCYLSESLSKNHFFMKSFKNMKCLLNHMISKLKFQSCCSWNWIHFSTNTYSTCNFRFLEIAFGFTRCKRYWLKQLILAPLSTKHLTCWFSTLTSTKFLSIADVNLMSGFLSVMHDKRAHISFLQHHPFWILRGAIILCLFYADLIGILKQVFNTAVH